MEKPKCKLCGERHWANERHAGSAEDGRKLDAVFRNVIPARPELLPPRLADSSSAAKQPKRKTKPRNPKLASVASHQPDTEPPKKRAPRGSFDRPAYQREYMRKRREAVRLTKPLD